MKLALVSLNQIWEDKKANLLLCEKYIEQASKKGVALVVFPEMTLSGFSNNISLTAEDFQSSQTIEAFSALAKKFNIAIIFGVVIKDGAKALNKSVFVSRSGEVVGSYAKIHPFSFAGEDRYFNAGEKLSVVNFEGMNIGLSICYDLRFPELYTALAKRSDIIINIANWPSKRVEHWNTLLKARAIENQLFIAGVNRTGIDNNALEYVQSTDIFNANGDKEECEEMDDMKIFEIEKSWTEGFKEKFNTTNDRKIEFYKEIL
ncbi:MAG: carbon-nitrogen family hydrolase [Sulfurimonas sp.]|nr:carbon-nitrogen family hydrolase [Sulfurimonas sp.]